MQRYKIHHFPELYMILPSTFTITYLSRLWDFSGHIRDQAPLNVGEFGSILRDCETSSHWKPISGEKERRGSQKYDQSRSQCPLNFFTAISGPQPRSQGPLSISRKYPGYGLSRVYTCQLQTRVGPQQTSTSTSTFQPLPSIISLESAKI